MATETEPKISECSVSQEKLNNAKNYLMQASVKSGLNLYEHLTLLLRRLLDERPENAVDILENISKQQKKKKLDAGLPPQNVGKESAERATEFALAEIQHKLFSKDLDDEAAADDNIESPLPNLLELFFYFEQAGVGFGREELIRIWLAMKNLVDSHPLETVRFWGKIFGLEQNYIIAEAEYREGEEEQEEEQEEEVKEEEKEEELDNDEEGERDDTPKPVVPPVRLVPKEENRTGANKKTYFVCHEPGKPWIKLPSVTPQQIVVARQIKKSFTGRLDAPIISNPPFNGTEANYLRAQIARISAGTLISPAGFYKFDEEDEVEEEGIRENFVEDLEYEPKNLVELLDPSMHNWVHHVLNILPQGRCTWVNPNKKDDEEEPEEDEEEEGHVKEEVRPEIGPPLLSPLSEDISIDGTAPWSIRLSSKLVPHAAVAVVRSNLWPGAYAFAKDKKFENVYVGYGHKFSANSFGPSQPPPLQAEFAQGQDLVEAEDPTPEQEAALKKAMAEGEEEEAGEEEAEEEED